MCVLVLNRGGSLRSIPQIVLVVARGFVLCLGLSIAAEAGDMKAGQSEKKGGPTDQKEMPQVKEWGHFIQGDVMRVDHGIYFVKDQNGKNIRLATDHTTQVMGEFQKGDRILARVTDQNHALSIIPAP